MIILIYLLLLYKKYLQIYYQQIYTKVVDMNGLQFVSKITADTTIVSFRQPIDDLDYTNVIDLNKSIKLSSADKENNLSSQDLREKIQAQNKLIKTLKISNELLEKTNKVLRRKNSNLENSVSHQNTDLDLLIKELAQRIEVYTEQSTILPKKSKGIRQLEELLITKENEIRSLKEHNQELHLTLENLKDKSKENEDFIENQALELNRLQNKCLESDKMREILQEKIEIIGKQSLQQTDNNKKVTAELEGAENSSGKELKEIVLEGEIQPQEASEGNIKIADNPPKPQFPGVAESPTKELEEKKYKVESNVEENVQSLEQMRIFNIEERSEEQLRDLKSISSKEMKEWMIQRKKLKEEKEKAQRTMNKLRIVAALSMIFGFCSWVFRMP